MRWSAFLWLISVPGLALAGDCPDFDSLGANAETAAQRLAQAEALYPAIYDNIGEFSELGPWVVDGVSCLTVPISPALAARYHRFRALQEDPLGGLSEAVRKRAMPGLVAAQRLQPEHVPSLPEDHGHRVAVEVVSAVEEVPAPRTGRLFFDGQVGLDRPVDSATFFQRMDADGLMVDSAYLLPGAPLPAYPGSAATSEVATTLDMISPPSRRGGLRAGAAVSAATAVALLGSAMAVRTRVMNPETGSYQDATGAQPLVNGLGFAAWASAAGSAGLLTASFVVK